MKNGTMAENKEEPNLVARSLKTGTVVTVLISAVLFNGGHGGWAWGFLIGSLISLFSLFSLFVLAPICSRPNAPNFSQALLVAVLVLKLPFYMMVLYFMTRMPGVDARSAFPGVILLPMVIGFKAIGGMVVEASREAQRKRAIRSPQRASMQPSQRTVPVARVLHTDPVQEQG